MNPTNEKINLLDTAAKVGSAVAPGIIVGLMGKLSWEITRGRKLRWYVWIAITFLSIVSGIFAHWLCVLWGFTGTTDTIMISSFTLLGEKLFMILFTQVNVWGIAKELFLKNISWLNSIVNKKK